MYTLSLKLNGTDIDIHYMYTESVTLYGWDCISYCSDRKCLYYKSILSTARSISRKDSEL